MNKFTLLLLVLLIPAAANGVEPGPTPLLTRLHVVAFHGDGEAIEELVEAGADVNARTRAGRTPLHRAVFKKQIETVRVLLAAGANVEAGEKSGVKPIDLADDQMITQLLEDASHRKQDSIFSGTSTHKVAF